MLNEARGLVIIGILRNQSHRNVLSF